MKAVMCSVMLSLATPSLGQTTLPCTIQTAHPADIVEPWERTSHVRGPVRVSLLEWHAPAAGAYALMITTPDPTGQRNRACHIIARSVEMGWFFIDMDGGILSETSDRYEFRVPTDVLDPVTHALKPAEAPLVLYIDAINWAVELN